MFGIHDHQTGQAGHFIGMTLDGDPFLKFGKADETGHLGDDGVKQRIPAGDHLAGVNQFVILDRQFRACLLYTSRCV